MDLPIVTADLSEAFTPQEDFFQNLNLCATKRIRIKYCRTIKERLRATTKEESLALPSSSRGKLGLSPSRRKPDDIASKHEMTNNQDEDEDVVKIRGGINVLKSIKRRKSDRSKNITPPSTKSLLSYLQPKAAEDDDLGDSSSVDSDASDVLEPFRLRPMSVSVNRLSNRNLAALDPSLRLNLPDSMRRRRRISASGPKICGFSHEISAETFAKNEQLKNIISDLESEINERELEAMKARALLSPEPSKKWSKSTPRREAVRSFTPDMKLGRDVKAGNWEATNNLNNTSSLIHGGGHTLLDGGILDTDASGSGCLNPGDTFSDIVDSKSDIVKLTDISVDTLKSELSEESEVVFSGSGVKVEDAGSVDSGKSYLAALDPSHAATVADEYSEFTMADLLLPRKRELATLSPPPLDIKGGMVTPVSLFTGETDGDDSVLGDRQMCRIHDSSTAVDKTETADGSGEAADSLASRMDAEIEIHDAGTPKEIESPMGTDPAISARGRRKSTESPGKGDVEISKKDGSKVRQRKNLKDKYKKLFLEKQLLLLENLKKQETQTASGGKLESQEKISGPKSGKETLKSINRKENFRQKKLKRLRENAKQIRKNRLRSEMKNPSKLPLKRRIIKKLPLKEKPAVESGDVCPEKEKPKPRLSTEDSGRTDTPPRRRMSTEVEKLGVFVKPYKPIILSRPVERPVTPPVMELTELDRDDRELEDILRANKALKPVERKRRGEPTFVPPFSSGDPRLDVLVNRTRQELMVYSRRTRFLEAKVRIIDINVYWTPKEVEAEQTGYKEHILAQDQISKATRKSKTFSRLSRPTPDDILRARRVLGIESADFNYADDEDELTPVRPSSATSRPPSASARPTSATPVSAERKVFRRRRRKEKSSGSGGGLRQSGATKRNIKDLTASAGGGGAGGSAGGASSARTLQINGEEFDIDNIESLVDNQPVDDSADSDNDDSWSDSGRTEMSPKGSGKFICGACGVSFSNRQGLELHEKKQLTCKPFSCKVCDKRFRSHKLCMKHQSMHTTAKSAATGGGGATRATSSGLTGSSAERKITFNCEDCGGSFIFIGVQSYMRHRKAAHAGQSLLKCSYSACQQELSSKAGLEFHLFRHNKNLQPWVCAKCQSRFVDVEKLRNHVINVHLMQKQMRKQYNMINVSKETKEDEDFDLESLIIFDGDNQQVVPTTQPLSSTPIVSSADQAVAAVSTTGNAALVTAAVAPEVAVTQIPPEIVQGLLETGEKVSPVQVQKELEAVNADLDIEVEYVDDIDSLLDSEPEPFPADQQPAAESPLPVLPLKAVTTSAAAAGQIGVLQNVEQMNEQELFMESSSELNDSVGEDIEKIKNFLDTEELETEGQGQVREEQLASENLSDIQRFLQLSNHTESPQADGDFVAPDLSVAAGSSSGGDDNDRPRVVSESSARPARTGSLLSEEVGGTSAAVKGKATDDDSEVVIMQELPAKVDRLSGFRIPRSPEFKKRLADKEAVSVKGIESLDARRLSKKAKQISFEEQLKIADKLEKPAKETRARKKSKDGDERKIIKPDSSKKSIKKLKKIPKIKASQSEIAVKEEAVLPVTSLRLEKASLAKAMTIPKIPKKEKLLPGTFAIKEPRTSVNHQELKLTGKAPPDAHKGLNKVGVGGAPLPSSSKPKSVVPPQKKSTSEFKLEPKVPPVRKSVSGPLAKEKLAEGVGGITKLVKSTSVPPATSSATTGGAVKQPGSKTTVHRSSIEAAKADKKIGSLSSYAVKGAKAREIDPTQIDLERIIRQPSKLKVGSMHNKSTPASSSTSSSGGGGGEGQSGAESTSAPVGPSVSKTSSTTGTEKDEPERPRDPRLHSSKQLKSQAVKQTETAKPADPKPAEQGQTGQPGMGQAGGDPSPVKPIREPMNPGSKMGLPIPVPAGSLSSEDEATPTPPRQTDRTTKMGPNHEAGMPRQSEASVLRSQEKDQGKGYYTDRYHEAGQDDSSSAAASSCPASVSSYSTAAQQSIGSYTTAAHSTASLTTSDSPVAAPSFGAALISSAVNVVAAASKYGPPPAASSTAASSYPTLLPSNFPTFDAPGSRHLKDSSHMVTRGGTIGSDSFPSSSSAPVYKTPTVSTAPVYKTPAVASAPVYKTPSLASAPVYKTPAVSSALVYKTPASATAPVYKTAGALIQLTPDPHNTPVISTRPIQPPIFARPAFGVTGPQLQLPGLLPPAIPSAGGKTAAAAGLGSISGSLVGLAGTVAGSLGGMAGPRPSSSSLGSYGGRTKTTPPPVMAAASGVNKAAGSKPAIKLMLPKPVPAAIASPVRVGGARLSCHVCRSDFKSPADLAKHICNNKAKNPTS